jgi:hypothetical protein
LPTKNGEGGSPHEGRKIQPCYSFDVASVWYFERRIDKVLSAILQLLCQYLMVVFRFDAFRSIFPAGTVSGAPKIKAIEIISSLEKERRGVYAGAVGRFDFADDEMDTCIAIRTMTFKDGVVYLQAGGGIVFDSVEEDEYVETLNKLGGNLKALEVAESKSSCVRCGWIGLSLN